MAALNIVSLKWPWRVSRPPSTAQKSAMKVILFKIIFEITSAKNFQFLIVSTHQLRRVQVIINHFDLLVTTRNSKWFNLNTDKSPSVPFHSNFFCNTHCLFNQRWKFLYTNFTICNFAFRNLMPFGSTPAWEKSFYRRGLETNPSPLRGSLHRKINCENKTKDNFCVLSFIESYIYSNGNKHMPTAWLFNWGNSNVKIQPRTTSVSSPLSKVISTLILTVFL